MKNENETPPLITVIVPVFNRWPHVCDAIESLLSQTYQNFECIVVDDASSDKSYENIKEKYSDNEKIRVVQLSKNSGQAIARNIGVQKASGSFICFLDSDDILLKDSLEARISVYNEEIDKDTIVSGGNISAEKSNTKDLKKRLTPITLDEYLIERGLIHTNTVMMRTASFHHLGGFNEELRQREDVEFFIRALCHFSAVSCGTYVAQMRAVDSSRARHDYEKIIKQGYAFVEALKNNKKLHEEASPKTLNNYISQGYNSYLNALYKTGRHKEYRSEIKGLAASKKIHLTKRHLKRILAGFLSPNK
ncbi:glycosyltransferase family 2 protein [Chromohalobacter sarecensis]|uniref:Glycosyltransferase family 2 protein n=1 Tax=Chromohalobacter sarecensis TaxID=245294 RepID=A0ABV9D3A2_9GAMM|nr:glycosyltransferase family A protein [Chromohalobacter sarecensis]MCK0714451.1 glycosyltransferase family 2 protein [Chromohalobacter sarecensis]